ncbi:hypothetical protein [Vannielia litorea]|nr:hypothetical protein [Vannielia litorea]
MTQERHNQPRAIAIARQEEASRLPLAAVVALLLAGLLLLLTCL